MAGDSKEEISKKTKRLHKYKRKRGTHNFGPG
jgi:hypothetical protein